MIIDDGSSDNTGEVVREWIREIEDFTILYYYKENGGLHTAYNEAIAHIETELCVCIDSDDYMPCDAIERILMFWEQHGSNEVAGIVGLDYDTDGNVIGDPLPDQKTVNLIDLLIGKYKINNGDRTNVVRTALYKEVAPMPIFDGEKNFNPHYMHLQISLKYDFLVMNENLRFVEYQTGGMSNSIFKQYRNSPRSFAEIRKLYLSFPNAGFGFRLKHCIHYVSSCILAHKRRFLVEFPYKGLIVLALPFGILLTVLVYYKTKNRTNN